MRHGSLTCDIRSSMCHLPMCPGPRRLQIVNYIGPVDYLCTIAAMCNTCRHEIAISLGPLIADMKYALFHSFQRFQTLKLQQAIYFDLEAHFWTSTYRWQSCSENFPMERVQCKLWILLMLEKWLQTSLLIYSNFQKHVDGHAIKKFSLVIKIQNTYTTTVNIFQKIFEIAKILLW